MAQKNVPESVSAGDTRNLPCFLSLIGEKVAKVRCSKY